MGISILIVDDDKLLVEKLEETVNWSGIGIDMVFTANNIRQAQKLLEEYPIEMLLCDIDMPQGNGLELLEWIRYKKAGYRMYLPEQLCKFRVCADGAEAVIKGISVKTDFQCGSGNSAAAELSDCAGKTSKTEETGEKRRE